MAKKRKIDHNTDLMSLYDRFDNQEMTPGDYKFIASQIKMYKGTLPYRLLKAEIMNNVSAILRGGKKVDESPYTLGLLSGMEYALLIIDRLAKYEDMAADVEVEEEEQHQIPSDNGSIEAV